MKTKTLRTNQSGSIMLEVVAVLALMGVMGAMLFRQIYQRNQELHNIQMASEIRTVKEAFSAYIQAQRAAVLSACEDHLGNCDPDVSICSCRFNDYDSVADYLPEGWFSESGELEDAYTLTLWYYSQNDGSGRNVVYGVVVPTTATLPTTGWNFKRAARVALLIGADGGAYDPSITHGKIAGSLGAWQIQNCDDEGGDCLVNSDTYPNGTYVATTGIDVFAPEYELPEGEVKLADDWSLGLNNLHAYNYFSVGNSSGSSKGCYNLGHDHYTSGADPRVESDTIHPIGDNCKPLFWVGSETGGANASSGNVYVATDLKIGAIGDDNKHNEALTLTKEGVIKQKDGLIIDKYGRLFSRDLVYDDIGDLKKGEHFVLDLARTSTMKDIRLASRGGVRLSDILPNYILKEQYDVNCSIAYNKTTGVLNDNNSSRDGIDPDTGNRTSVVSWCDAKKLIKTATGDQSYIGPALNFPDCPTGYKKAVVVIPSFFGNAYTKKGHTHNKVISDGAGDTEHSHGTGGAVYSDSRKTNDTGTVYNEDGTNGIHKGDQFITDICQSIALVDVGANQHTLGLAPWVIDEPVNDTFRITLGYRNNIGNGSAKADNGKVLSYVCKDATFYGQILHATVQTYCVWTPSLLTTLDACKAAGYKWDNSATPKCTGEPFAEYNMADQSDALEIDEDLCECLGFEWGGDSNPRCIYKFIKPSKVKDLENNTCAFEEWHKKGTHQITHTEMITICKMLGYDWDGVDCNCPGDQTWNDKYGCQNPDPT